MVYADYQYYTGTYLGNAIAEADFPRLAKRASEEVDHRTYRRAAAYYASNPDPIREAVCAVAEIIQQAELGSTLGGNARLQTEITGQHHTTYFASMDTASETGRAAINAAIQQAVSRHLLHTGLLYSGVY